MLRRRSRVLRHPGVLLKPLVNPLALFLRPFACPREKKDSYIRILWYLVAPAFNGESLPGNVAEPTDPPCFGHLGGLIRIGWC